MKHRLTGYAQQFRLGEKRIGIGHGRPHCSDSLAGGGNDRVRNDPKLDVLP